MVRYIAGLVGVVFIISLLAGLYGSVSGLINDPQVEGAAAALYKHPKELELESNGFTGKIDMAAAQRGFQVYKEVCANCHSLKHVAFRDLKKIGYTDAEVKKIAADWGTKQSVQDPKTGDRTERANVPADHFPPVYYPGQGVPPDLSLITKARHDGPAYIYSLLTGYAEQTPELIAKHPDAKTPDGLYYNPYFPNLNIAMPPPLAQDGQVTYADGTKSTVAQNAKDVAAFLVWTAEPELNDRHALGLAVLGFLLVATILAYGAYQSIWRNVKH
ncbi:MULTISPECIES: cytochrome c1 [Sphingomonas]|uniref:cytochrome c1 n=1 Tax=Sphingomonas TaxID=13687 RepID=UPI0008329D91|nr:cytochrome c1 [Sphingomonas sp. CCH10-B3]MBA3878532.1 cytochrome c1 [Sphingobium sp.]